MPIHPNETDLDMTLATVIKRHTPYQMSGREWGDTRVEYVLYCGECACRAIECDVAVVVAEVERLRAALVEHAAFGTAAHVLLQGILNDQERKNIDFAAWWAEREPAEREVWLLRARRELTAEGLLPPA